MNCIDNIFLLINKLVQTFFKRKDIYIYMEREQEKERERQGGKSEKGGERL